MNGLFRPLHHSECEVDPIIASISIPLPRHMTAEQAIAAQTAWTSELCVLLHAAGGLIYLRLNYVVFFGFPSCATTDALNHAGKIRDTMRMIWKKVDLSISTTGLRKYETLFRNPAALIQSPNLREILCARMKGTLYDRYLEAFLQRKSEGNKSEGPQMSL